MQIRVEIEVKPEELRRFLGLPDIAGLQEDLMAFVKDKVGQASEGLSPAADFVRDNIDQMKNSSALQRLLSSVRVRVKEAMPDAVAPQRKPKARRKRKKTASVTKPRPRTVAPPPLPSLDD